MEKVLTVVVPCYNSAWCLEQCLSSFLDESILDRLEVIVVNDGSTDGTLGVATKCMEQYPHVFRLIDKENGGHGSGINVAIQQATGKYFKVVDSDDWVITKNLKPFIDILTETNVDVVITHFYTTDMVTGKTEEYKTKHIPLGKVYTLDEFAAYPNKMDYRANIHGLTYRTALYRNNNIVLSEGIFYEDQEYATFPFSWVKTVLPLDVFLNVYMVGNENQSVSAKNQVKNMGHVEQVTRNLFHWYHEHSAISEGGRRYIARKAIDMLLGYYIIALIKNPDKLVGRREVARVRREMQTFEPMLVDETNSMYRLALIMSFLRFNDKTLEMMKRPLPYALFRMIFKRN